MRFSAIALRGCPTVWRRLTTFCLLLTAAMSAPASATEVPAALAPWVGWVMDGQEQRACPVAFNEAERFFCSWPSRLSLRFNQRELRFAQTWTLHVEDWVALPGSADHWPERVSISGAPAQVVALNGVPSVRLPKGVHRITGSIPWASIPDRLTMPPLVGLIDLQRDGVGPLPVVVDENHQLWLVAHDGVKAEADDRAQVQIEVVRHLSDTLPAVLDTRVRLHVTGADREWVSGPALPSGYAVLSVDSPLPVRIENDGQLRVQLRSGTWELAWRARQQAPVLSTVTLPEPQADWPASELWAIEEHAALRRIDVTGIDRYDPSQANFPGEWLAWPVYRVVPGLSFQIEELQRGDANPGENQLSLNRKAWLDFSGQGLTFEDQVQGSMVSRWRLDAQNGMQLGSVENNGELQLVTQGDVAGVVGVELRQSPIALRALSRYETRSQLGRLTLPVSGWSDTFQTVNERLALPPGWRAIGVSGADQVMGSWLDEWTILDVFYVVFAAAIVAWVLGRPAGVLAFAVLTLTYHEPGAPFWIWLNLAALVALAARPLSHRLQTWVRSWRIASYAALALLLLSFCVAQMRLVMYPQLEHYSPLAGQGYRAESPVASASAVMDYADESLAVVSRSKLKERGEATYDGGASRPLVPDVYGKDTRLQTGPGLPTWEWNTLVMSWVAPVSAGMEVDVWLLSPWQLRVWRLLSMAGMLGLAALFMLRLHRQTTAVPQAATGTAVPVSATTAAVALVAAALIAVGVPAPAEASDFPPASLLDQLKTRLSKAPDCLPACAGLNATAVVIDGYQLTMTQQFAVLADVAVPLPVQGREWAALRVLVNGQEQTALRWRDDGYALLALSPGNHEVVIEASVRERDELSLSFPIALTRFELRADDWTVSGLVDGRPASGVVQFHRREIAQRQDEARQTLFQPTAEAFVSLDRHLVLGSRWVLENTVSRVAPERGAVSVRLPLLEGEQVATQAFRVDRGEIDVVIPDGQSQVSWTSELAPREQWAFAQPDSANWSERWSVQVGRQWHVDFVGVSPVKPESDVGHWQPRWAPRPGEQLQLNVRQLTAAPGKTLTIDAFTTEYRARSDGEYQATLTLTMRASLGEHFRFSLPEGMSARRVSLDGMEQTLPATGPLDVVIPPGTHQLVVDSFGSLQGQAMQSLPPIQLPEDVANQQVVWTVPDSRWLLFTGGTGIGPAILYWGMIPVLLLVALILGRLKANPLSATQWFLMLLGISLVHPVTVLAPVVWFHALNWRREHFLKADAPPMSWHQFNLMQLGFCFMLAVAVAVLISAIPSGLLGQPDMFVTGNGSSASTLHWYNDRLPSGESLTAWTLTVPMMAYRGLMLAWSLWMAMSMVAWLRWSFQSISTGGFWREAPPVAAKPEALVAASTPTQSPAEEKNTP